MSVYPIKLRYNGGFQIIENKEVEQRLIDNYDQQVREAEENLKRVKANRQRFWTELEKWYDEHKG